jgi:hypothetical protein
MDEGAGVLATSVYLWGKKRICDEKIVVECETKRSRPETEEVDSKAGGRPNRAVSLIPSEENYFCLLDSNPNQCGFVK